MLRKVWVFAQNAWVPIKVVEIQWNIWKKKKKETIENKRKNQWFKIKEFKMHQTDSHIHLTDISRNVNK